MENPAKSEGERRSAARDWLRPQAAGERPTDTVMEGDRISDCDAPGRSSSPTASSSDSIVQPSPENGEGPIVPPSVDVLNETFPASRLFGRGVCMLWLNAHD